MDTLTHRAEPGARQERRRRRALRRRLATGATIGIPILVLLIVAIAGSGSRTSIAPGSLGGAAEGSQITYLLVGTRADDPSGQADWLSLMAVDRSGRQPVTIFIPTATQAELPGYGFDSLGKALALGRVPLQQIAVENVLQVHIDHTVIVPDTALRKLFDRAGGIDVTVRAKLLRPQGADTLVPAFEPGRQHLDPARALAYFEYQGSDEDELARLARAKDVWQALYARFGEKRSNDLATIVTSLGARPARSHAASTLARTAFHRSPIVAGVAPPALMPESRRRTSPTVRRPREALRAPRPAAARSRSSPSLALRGRCPRRCLGSHTPPPYHATRRSPRSPRCPSHLDRPRRRRS